jgi:NADH-quinone oxidoreductase subunit J
MNFAFDPSLQFYVTLADIAFAGFVALALIGGIIAVGAKKLIHAVLGLIVSLTGVAGLYVYLGNHFIAAMQILIYVGAVSISMVFAVMLARTPEEEVKEKPAQFAAKIASGALVGLFAAYVVGRAVLNNEWKKAAEVTSYGSVAEIGEQLLTRHAFVFELISLVLLVAIAGSVVVASRGRGTPSNSGGNS